MSIAAFIGQYGYLAIFLGMAVEGETFLILGGISAHQGILSLPVVMLSAFAGTVIAIQILFHVGRAQGKKIFEKRPHWEPKIAKIHYHFDRHDLKVLLFFRFLIGFRTIIPLLIGTTTITAARFFILNVAGALIWTISIGYLGYLFGRAFKALFAEIQYYETIIIVILALGTIIALIAHHIIKKRAALKNNIS
jgi:membrane protein DedA with SNARE-associated domain